MREIKGVIPALITPYRENGEINKEATKQLVSKLLEQGVDGFYVSGSTGESLLHSLDERKFFLDCVMEANQGRAKVIFQTGTIATKDAIDLARYAKKVSADAISSLPPFYYKFSAQEIEQFYYDIMDSVDLPIIIYNIPFLTGVNMLTSCPNLFKDKRVYGVKHTTPSPYEMVMFKNIREDLKLYNGFDEQFIANFSMGADGGIGSTYNFQADKFVLLYKTLLAGDFAKGKEIQEDINRAITTILQTGLYPSIKYIIEKKFNIIMGGCRKPFAPLTEENRKKLDKFFNF